jgi:hypothetical protein
VDGLVEGGLRFLGLHSVFFEALPSLLPLWIEEPEAPFHHPEDDEAMEDANTAVAQANMSTAITIFFL